jgi:chromosome segregation ATPase|tara:strand:- start:308 stop:583 length:276 start_codon:yes stop_codon:yes gene_type:complete
MSENKKFTTEELEKITALRDENQVKVGEFGQIELEILLTTQRLEALAEAKNKLTKDYQDLQDKERDLIKELNEKYGAGQVDLNSGEFIPTN